MISYTVPEGAMVHVLRDAEPGAQSTEPYVTTEPMTFQPEDVIAYPYSPQEARGPINREYAKAGWYGWRLQAHPQDFRAIYATPEDTVVVDA